MSVPKLTLKLSFEVVKPLHENIPARGCL